MKQRLSTCTNLY